jgi:4-hydroxyphenylpyruvate dioxygenase
MELNIPAIEGIGGSLIYLVDRYDSPTIYDIDFILEPGVQRFPPGVGLAEIDHPDPQRRQRGAWTFSTTFTVGCSIFASSSSSTSRANTPASRAARCRRPAARFAFRSTSRNSRKVAGKLDQIQEFIEQYHGEGIQHVALRTNDILKSWDALRATDSNS